MDDMTLLQLAQDMYQNDAAAAREYEPTTWEALSPMYKWHYLGRAAEQLMELPEPEEMIYVGTPDGSSGYEIPVSEMNEILEANKAADPHADQSQGKIMSARCRRGKHGVLWCQWHACRCNCHG